MPAARKKTKKTQEPRAAKASPHKPDEKTDDRKLLSAPKLFVESLHILVRNWKVFTGIVLVYGLLTILLVQGINNGNLEEAKTALEERSASQFLNSVTLFVYMAGSSSNAPNGSASIFQLLLALITGLAAIWAL